LQQLETLEDAMALARAYENRLAMPSDTTGRFGSRQAFSRTKQLALPAPQGVAGSTVGTTPRPALKPRFKRLTVAEMAAKRARDKCYNCTEKFTKEHLEVCPVKSIFLLELDTPTAADPLDGITPQISLNAITRISATETMKPPTRLSAYTVMALVDSGSTHSFISTEVACRLHLEPVFHPGLQVAVTNGDKVTITGVCRAIQFVIDKEAFVMDFFIIPLAGYKMVLSVQWLWTLGPILWDFAHARKSCWRDDHRIYWHGVAIPGAPTAIHALASTDLMATLLQEFDDIFMIPTGLPPPRRRNHCIHLLLNTAPIAVRPYRYP
jgi:hypothetical protein